MTKHLSPDEQLAAIDEVLPADRRAHAGACAVCRGRVDALRATLEAARLDQVPEPSPLFWEHFSARVRAAVDAEASTRRAWIGWRTWVAGGSAAAALVAVLIGRGPMAEIPPTSARLAPVAPVDDAAAVDADATTSLLPITSRVSLDDLTQVVASDEEAGALIEDLNPAERAAFVRLLHAEMESIQ